MRDGGIKVRLDRAVASQAWMDQFPRFKVHHLKKTTSDHILIFIYWEGRVASKRKRTFRYEEAWNNLDGCKPVVEEGWAHEADGVPLFQVTDKIKSTRRKLSQWARQNSRHGPKEIGEIENKLTSILGQPFTDTSINEKKVLLSKLNGLLEQEECFWRQRSKEN
ncbi:uncharacterized protein LOC125469072 [Pyrus x bretschneideri]|uniref:uncharacterized protein LOC125469072 n=1 Tax=Pyrus x bretschneideri TaxID=225117 RepID=UPI00202FB7AB|nr:uncharacterized protein LOC125469072 [Pyrus x bretschneideri]